MRPRLASLLALGLLAALVPAAPARAVSVTVVINELHTATVAGSDADAYVELRNVSAAPVDISGWDLDRCNDGGARNGQATVYPGTVLEPGEHYLFVAESYDYGVAGDQSMSTSITPGGGAVLSDAAGNEVDGVGYSAGPCTEGAPAQRPADTSRSVSRTDGADTDDNAADFTATDPSPTASVTAPSRTVVVNELRTNTAGGTKDGFVELRNVSDAPVDISDWSFVGCNAGAESGTRAVIPAGTTLEPGEHYLLTNTDYPGEPGDQVYDVGLATEGGARLFDAAGALVDGVGLTRTQPCTESEPAPALGSDGTRTVQRDDSGTDTQDNSADFTLADATPTRSQDEGSGAEPLPPVRPATVAATVEEGDLVLEQVVEAEDLLPPETSTSRVFRAGVCCGIVRSGDAAITFGGGGGEPGDFMTLSLEVPADGRWQLEADHTIDPSFGISRLSIDGTAIGEFNHYNQIVDVDRRVAYEPLDLTAGEHELRFEIIGQDDRSSGYRIGTDLYRLRRLPEPDRVALTPPDGAFVSGVVPILGYSTAADDQLRLAIDGQPVDDRAAIGSESATLVFEADGMQSESNGFRNRLEVRGQGIPLASNVEGDDGFEFYTDWVDVPGELLAPGRNTVTVVAGENDRTCDGQSGFNRDDFTIRDVRLELPDGTVLTDPERQGEYALGDGLCGSNETKPRRLDFAFDIPDSSDPAVDYEPGRGFVWDTTEVADGDHTVTLTATGPEETPAEERTHTVLVDNTVPRITGTSPAQDERLKGDYTVGAEADDGEGSGVETITATLDGEPVPVPSSGSSDDLAGGEHTFAFTATDRAGNATTETVTVTSVAEQPDTPTLVAPGDGAIGVATDPELSVTATDPAGDPLEVTFLEATASGPEAGAAFGGTTGTAPPSVLAPDGEERLDEPEAASSPDDVYVDAGPSDAFPYQRFDLRLGADVQTAEDVEVTWEGRADPAREVVLSAYDVGAEEWVELDRGRGLAGGDLALASAVDVARFRDGDVVHVLLQGSDPFADDIADEPDERFRDPETYDFSLAWMTDTQYLSEGKVEGRPGFGEAYRDINTWIVENAEERKITYAAHTGDLINNWIRTGSNGDTPEYEQLAREEFAFARDTMEILGDAGMPYGVTPGNHDNKFGTSNELYNEYFGPDFFESQSARAAQDYYAGPGASGDNQNHVDLFNAAGQDFVVVYLGFIAGQEEIDWANDALEQHADRKAIFATHEYLRPSNQPDGRNGRLSDENARSQGEELFNEVVLPNENVFLTLSGHTHGVALNIRRNQGPQGRTVVEMLANYQFYRVEGERRVGHFRLLQFDVDRSEMSVNTYSPTLDDHNADEYDTSNNRDYTPAADEFTVPIDLESRSTSFGTDAIRLERRTDDVIGTDGVASGEEASAVWEGREPSTAYAWYARASDDFGGSAESDVFAFTTGEAAPEATPPPGPGPGDTTAPPRPTIVAAEEIDVRNEDAYPVRGDAEEGSTVQVRARDADGDEVTGTDVANSPYEVVLDVSALSDGDVTLTATATDEAGNTSAPARTTVTKQTGAGGGPPAEEDTDAEGGPPPGTDPTAPPGADDDAGTRRISGEGRTQTALEISRQTFDEGGAGAVVLSRPDIFPDALAGTPLAITEDAPLLLTAREGLEEEVATEIGRVLPAGGTVYLLGGTAALSPQVATDVEALGFEARRYGGANRFATAAIVAAEGLGSPETVILADGSDFPDAIAAGSAAGNAAAAVLLTGGTTVPPETAAYLQTEDGAELIAVGGPAARAVPSATPLVGGDRIQTAVEVAEELFDGPPAVGLATGAAFPDALAGGAAVGRQGGPLLLTFGERLDPRVADYLRRNAGTVDRVLIFGGERALSDEVAEAAGRAIQE